jgi:hypothetical protein
MLAAAAMSLSSVSVIANALRLRRAGNTVATNGGSSPRRASGLAETPPRRNNRLQRLGACIRRGA